MSVTLNPMVLNTDHRRKHKPIPPRQRRHKPIQERVRQPPQEQRRIAKQLRKLSRHPKMSKRTEVAKPKSLLDIYSC